MELLFTTDNAFYASEGAVYDQHSYDRRFFDDYRAVFERVVVAARLRSGDPPQGSRRADGSGVSFVGFKDVHGPRWALAPMRAYCSALPGAAKNAEAVCVRIPSTSGIFAARLATKLNRPLMFELIGDPIRQVGSFGLGGRLYGHYLAFWTRWIVRRAQVGSYVSRRHLQAKFPPGAGTITDSLSSIRLPDSDLVRNRAVRPVTSEFKIILVAGFFPYKDHRTLLRATRIAEDRGVRVRVDLVGDGPQRPAMEALAKRLQLKSVVFHGHVASPETIKALLDNADLFVMTSVGEGLPRAMIEAMARGLPCVGADTEAIAELLTPGQMFPVGDAHALAFLMEKAAREPQQREVWSEHSTAMAQEFVASRLSGRRQRLLALLRECAMRGPHEADRSDHP